MDYMQQVLYLPLVHRCHGDDLLCQHVQAMSGYGCLLDGALDHESPYYRRLQKVHGVLGEKTAFAGCGEQVAGTAHPLQAAGHRLGRFYLHHQVHRSDVDAKLQGGCGYYGGQLALFQLLLYLVPFLSRERAVMGAHHLTARQVVEAHCEFFGQGPVANEHQGGTVLPDHVQKSGNQRVPRRIARHVPEVLDGTDNLEVHLPPPANVQYLHPSWYHRSPLEGLQLVVAAEKASHLPQRTHGGRKPHALKRLPREFLQPLQGKGEVYAPLVRRKGMHLIYDDVADGGQDASGLRRGEEQVEGFRGGNENVRGPAYHSGTDVGGGISGAYLYGDGRPFFVPHLGRFVGDALQWHLEVAVYVVVQGFERRNV